MQRATVRLLVAVVPPVLLAGLGLLHPVRLDDAPERWRDLHVAALFVFPLLGVAPWLVLRPRHPRLAVVAAVLGYGFACGYTALDVLAGIGAGALAVAGEAGRGTLYHWANLLAMPALLAYLAATVLAGAAGVLAAAGADRMRLRLAVPGAVLAVAGAVSFLTSHIFPPRGVVTMLVLAAGWGLLAAASAGDRDRPAPHAVH